MRKANVGVVMACAVVGSLLAHRVARAEELIIKQPEQHPDYVAEIEPHGIFIFGVTVGRLYPGQTATIGFGPGVRANFRLLKNGFIPSLNNSIAVGIGAELSFDTYGNVRLITPVVMQWNFWVTKHWSVMGEPGVAIEFPMSTPGVGVAYASNEPIYLSPFFAVGARYSFNEHIALTMRLGYPVTSVGISFFM